ncbi:DUF4625 domain-containing protein [Sphingobacterium chuzhouense]|uniref:DUF4625 domain-containing protein n=1 Tax=Sphingobacterium chuzhouense TaxID=1742264 RepID=A0ABR7XP75_9SPHI|nr:DUF4625 domain-containing protein [Sphingobacterium chuzhouense]MBD1420968.1 DUF4625 domain-containing protein [Sphingobacterium chuzhouense]
MTKYNRFPISIFLLLALFISGCEKGKEDIIDDVPPEIHIDFGEAFPIQCSTLKKGEKFAFRARFSDNTELGTYSLDIHHNFDHHSHTTEFEECNLQPKKDPLKPFLFIRSYDIPKGQKSYEAVQEIEIPSDIDAGDYHFMIMVTDATGWSKMIGLSIKIE